MTGPETYSFRRYLHAKRTVDERALNRRVRGRVQTELAEGSPPLDVIEVGPGIGATIERVLTWDALPGQVHYTAVDIDPELLACTRARLLELSDDSPFEVHQRDETLIVEREGRTVVVDLVVQDIFEFIEGTDRDWDLLVAQALLDLTGVQSALDAFSGAVVDDGLLYFPITFDGVTILEPPLDPAFDDRIERRYHHDMDSGDEPDDEGGDSRAGRHLLAELPARGGEVLAAGSSDWTVVPGSDGYPADEAYFLHHIIQMVRDAVTADPELDPDRVDEWVESRHRQIEQGQLVYIAHQFDVLGRSP